MATPSPSIAAVQILRVTTRFLPPALRPPLWRRAALVLACLIYGGLAAAVIFV